MINRIAHLKWHCLVYAFVLLASCKKDADVLPKELYAYVPPGNDACNVLSGNTILLL
ncbi:MAG: hypothetical protein ACTHMM_04750 [Agriterribacter sp.]